MLEVQAVTLNETFVQQNSIITHISIYIYIFYFIFIYLLLLLLLLLNNTDDQRPIYNVNVKKVL